MLTGTWFALQESPSRRGNRETLEHDAPSFAMTRDGRDPTGREDVYVYVYAYFTKICCTTTHLIENCDI